MKNASFHAIVSDLIHGRKDEAERKWIETDREAFAAWAGRHRLASILFHLGKADGGIREALNAERLANVADCLSRKQWITEVFEAGEKAGVRFGVFKGLGIAHMKEVYPEPYMRPLGDVDLWVERGSLDEALRIMEGMGFQQASDDPAVRDFFLKESYHVPLAHPDFGELELHHAYHRDLCGPFFEAMFKDRPEVKIWIRPSLRPSKADLMNLLCLHLGIQHEALIWIWLMDIQRMQLIFSEKDWAELSSKVKQAETAIFVHAIMTLLPEIWGSGSDSGYATEGKQLSGLLTARERKAVEAWVKEMLQENPSGDGLSLARRLSGRPVRGRSTFLNSVFCHPGVVCRELGVRSDGGAFWFHRLRHIVMRTRRGVLGSLR